MLFKFGMADSKSISTLLDRNVKLRPDSGQACESTQFRQIIGSLIYLRITRTDLSYPVGLISQYMATRMSIGPETLGSQVNLYVRILA